MTALFMIRTAAWVAIAALGIVLTVATIGGGFGDLDKRTLPLSAGIGGPFKLATHDGKTLTERDLTGKPFAIFFGFTNCPDVCPTSLLDMTNRIKDLGADAAKMRYVFVTVDPEADTAAHLRTYLSNFDPAIIGLTGPAEAVNEIIAAYRVVVQRVPTTTGYTINHTATTFLMDAQGRLAGTLAYQEPDATQIEKLRRLVATTRRP